MTKPAKKKSAPKPVAKKKPTRPTKVARPSVPRHAASPESPAILEGIDRSGGRSAAREMSWAEFDRVVSQLSAQVKKLKIQAVVGVAHGGVFVGGALASALAVEFYPVRLSRRSRDQGRSAAPQLTGTMSPELKGKKVLIVDDIAASGDTLELATALVKAVGAKSVLTATLVSRPDGYEPDFCWDRSNTFMVFPWDYDLNADGRFRELM